MPLIEKRIDPQHPEKFHGQPGRELSNGDVESVEGQEIGAGRQPDKQATAEAVAEFLKKDEVISPELQAVRKTISQVTEKSDTVAHQQLVADILNGKVDPVNLEKPGSAFEIRQAGIEAAKRAAEEGKN